MTTNEQAVELVRLEREAVELVREYAYSHMEFMRADFYNPQPDNLRKAKDQAHVDVLKIGCKLLKQDNEAE